MSKKTEIFSKFAKEDLKVFETLNTPAKIQNYIDHFPTNFEYQGNTYYPPVEVLKKNKAHCAEGAVLAALILYYNGEKPLLLDLKTTKPDVDHVIALYKKFGHWGAISKTNHAVLRFREPIYKTIRELALSYFHEYFVDTGQKTLRSYSNPFDLTKVDNVDWVTSEEWMWDLMYQLDKSKHHPLLDKSQIKNLRKADLVEIQAGKIVREKKKKK
jgi:hypothetical protein